MLFSIVLSRDPKSASAGSRFLANYQKRLAGDADARYKSAAVVSGRLYIQIIWFARKKGGPDIDNIIKPIVDELKGIVYQDDSLISQCLSVRIDLDKPYQVSNDNISDDDYQEIVDMINLGDKDVLYIEVGNTISQQAVFGPIDGGAR